MLKSFTMVLVTLLFHQSLSSTGSHEAIHDPFNKTAAVAVADDACCPTAANLTSISLNLTLTEAAKIYSGIEMMLKNQTWDPNSKTLLESCSDMYNCTLSSLNQAVNSLTDRRYLDLSSWVDSARECAMECEDDFGDASPLTKENNYSFQLCQIAFDISILLISRFTSCLSSCSVVPWQKFLFLMPFLS